jgi:hypothetical protein
MAYAGAAHLESLTGLIRDAFSALERARPDAPAYGGIRLRGTMERRLFIDAARDPAQALGPLSRALAAVKAPFDHARFSGWHAESPPTLSTRVSDFLRAQRSLASILLHGRKGRPPETRRDDGRPKFLFCVIDPKFVTFFKPIIERLGDDRCALLCLGSGETELEARRRGFSVVPEAPSRLALGSLSPPPAALGVLYAEALRLLSLAQGALKIWSPKCLVIAEGSSPQEEAAGRAARAMGVPTVRIQYGRGGVMHPGYYDMQFDKMLMWGEGFSERIRPYSPQARYVVTGSPLFDPAPAQQGDTALSSFTTGAPVLTVITQPVSVNILASDYEALAALARAVLDRAPQAKVLVRRHPGDHAGAFDALAASHPERVRVTRAADYPLRAVLDASTLVVGLFSTALSEAAALGVLPVVLRLGERHRIFPAPEDEGAAVLAESIDEGVESVVSLLGAAERRARFAAPMRRFAQRYFGQRDGGALDRIVHHIEQPEA